MYIVLAANDYLNGFDYIQPGLEHLDRAIEDYIKISQGDYKISNQGKKILSKCYFGKGFLKTLYIVIDKIEEAFKILKTNKRQRMIYLFFSSLSSEQFYVLGKLFLKNKEIKNLKDIKTGIKKFNNLFEELKNTNKPEEILFKICSNSYFYSIKDNDDRKDSFDSIYEMIDDNLRSMYDKTKKSLDFDDKERRYKVFEEIHLLLSQMKNYPNDFSNIFSHLSVILAEKNDYEAGKIVHTDSYDNYLSLREQISFLSSKNRYKLFECLKYEDCRLLFCNTPIYRTIQQKDHEDFARFWELLPTDNYLQMIINIRLNDTELSKKIDEDFCNDINNRALDLLYDDKLNKKYKGSPFYKSIKKSDEIDSSLKDLAFPLKGNKVSKIKEIAALLGVSQNKAFRLMEENCLPKPFYIKNKEYWDVEEIFDLKPYVGLSKMELLAIISKNLKKFDEPEGDNASLRDKFKNVLEIFEKIALLEKAKFQELENILKSS